MDQLPNFPTPHCHIKSLDSASTPKAFVKREKELGTGCITCTDHGSMNACREVYDLAKKNGLTPILGVEAYFRDDKCPILLAAGITDIPEYAKYFHITIHTCDQEAYEALIRVLSRASLNRTEKHGSEYKPLFDWADLEELAKYNVTATTGCLVGMVQRHLLNGREDLADAYALKLKEIFGDKLYVEIFPHKTDKNWVNGAFFEFADGTKRKFYAKKNLRVTYTSKGKSETVEVQAGDFAKKFQSYENPKLLAIKNYTKWEEGQDSLIVSAKWIEDYIENDCMPGALDSDSQKWCNHKMITRATVMKVPILISDDAHFATPDEKKVQDIRLMSGGDSWRFYASYHRFTTAEAWKYFSEVMELHEENGGEEAFSQWVQNNLDWAGKFKNFTLKSRRELPTKFYPSDTLSHTRKLIAQHGRMDWRDTAMVNRLMAEIQMLHENGVIDQLPYFFVDEEVCSLYEKSGLLTGPGRGSAAGLLLSYLIGITHVNPLRYQLSMERFMTEARIQNGKLPDIDQDLPTRELLVNEADPSKGWLKERFGDCVAQISTDTQLRLKSSIKDVARVMLGEVPVEIHKLCSDIEDAPQGVEDQDFIFGYEGAGGWEEGSIDRDTALQEYIRKYPNQWEIVRKVMGLTRQKSRHACAYVITNEPVSNFIPLTKIGDYVVTQYTAKSVEAAGGLKMDFLVINILNDISKAIKLIQERNGGIRSGDTYLDGKRVPAIRQVPLGDKVFDIWDLPEDKAVFNDICMGKTETVFQLHTPIARSYLRLFNYPKDKEGNKAIDSIEAIAAFTSLDRPGPLDAYVTDEKTGKKHNMLVEYANRARGEAAVNPIKALDDLLPETYGVIVYQEQLQKIYQVIGKTTAIEADEFRVHIGKKYQGYEQYRLSDRDTFMKGAVESVGKETAEAIWDQMYTFGQYGFNKSHAVSYSIIGYACAFLKHYYPTEWWCAILSNADRNEIDTKFWRYCWDMVLVPDIKKSGAEFVIEGDKIRAPLSFIHGVGEAAHQEIQWGRPYQDIKDFVNKVQQRRITTGKPTVDSKGKPKLKLGYSALNRGVCYNLIISGTCDSLFDGGSTYDKLSTYEQVLSEVTGKKPKAIKEDFLNMDQIVRFQVRKEILPSYSEPILPMLLERKVGGVSWDKTREAYYYYDGDDSYRFVTHNQLERLSMLAMLPDGGISVAVAAYIMDARKFKYQGGSKEALELQVDHDGRRFKTVKWSGGKGKLPKDFQQDLKGSVAILVLNRWNENKPDFSIDKINVVRPPLSNEKDEESKE